MTETSIETLGKNKLHRLQGRALRAFREFGAPGLKRLNRFCDRPVGPMYAPTLDIFEPFSETTVDYRLGPEHDVALYGARFQYIADGDADLLSDPPRDDHLEFVLDGDDRHGGES
jgi:hypothetical protein